MAHPLYMYVILDFIVLIRRMTFVRFHLRRAKVAFERRVATLLRERPQWKYVIYTGGFRCIYSASEFAAMFLHSLLAVVRQ